MEFEFSEPHHVTVGFTGEPGERTFFLQAQEGEQLLTLQMEKGQVEGLGELLGQLLARVDDAPATDWDREAMDLRTPVVPAWQVGEIALGLDPDVERFALEVTEVVAAEDADPEFARIWCDRDQARRLAAHASEVVGQGRPRCELCGRPTAVDGDHVCPATNGHGHLTR